MNVVTDVWKQLDNLYYFFGALVTTMALIAVIGDAIYLRIKKLRRKS